MSASGRFAVALLWRKTSKRWHPILPLRGLGISLGVIVFLGFLAIVEDAILGNLASNGDLNSALWSDENQKITSQNYHKIKNTQTDPIFRSAGYEPPKVDFWRKRILIIGDSFVWGDGSTNINTLWWRQLQWEIERRGYFNVDVIAAGRNGASTQDQLAWLNSPDFLESAHPDAIIFGYVTNDPQMKDDNGVHIVKQLQGTEYYQVGDQIKHLFPHLGFELQTRINGKLHMVPNDTTGYPYNEWELKILEGKNFEEYKLMLKRLAINLRQINVPAFFVTTPNWPGREAFEMRYKPVAEAMKEAGLEFFDLLPEFLRCCEESAIGQYDWVINPANGHPGPRSTHFYAAQIVALLEAKYPELLGQKSSEPYHAPAINDWMPASLMPISVSDDTWTFLYPDNDSDLLSMPIGQKHVALNFERPVSISKISLHTRRATRFSVWAVVLNDRDDYEEKQCLLAGEQQGTETDIAFSSALVGKRITSLRIAANPLQTAKDSGLGEIKPVVVLDAEKISRWGDKGEAYRYDLPELSSEADDIEIPDRSTIMLLENGKPGFPHAAHQEIIKKGKGLYSHWQSVLVFSSSDGSDPRKNRRTYSLIRARDWTREKSNPIQLKIKFNSPAVKL